MHGGRFTVSPLFFWEWWPFSARRIRFAVAVALLVVGGLMALGIRLDVFGPARDRRALAQPVDAPPPRDYRGPIWIGGLGFVILIFSARSKAEALGYQDLRLAVAREARPSRITDISVPPIAPRVSELS